MTSAQQFLEIILYILLGLGMMFLVGYLVELIAMAGRGVKKEFRDLRRK